MKKINPNDEINAKILQVLDESENDIYTSNEALLNINDSNSTDPFPEIWKVERPLTVNKYVLQKLNELEQEVKTLKEIITQYDNKTNTRSS